MTCIRNSDKNEIMFPSENIFTFNHIYVDSCFHVQMKIIHIYNGTYVYGYNLVRQGCIENAMIY